MSVFLDVIMLRQRMPQGPTSAENVRLNSLSQIKEEWTSGCLSVFILKSYSIHYSKEPM